MSWLTVLYLVSLFSHTLGLGQKSVISFNSTNGRLRLVGGMSTPSIMVDGQDWPGVVRTASDLAKDFGQVTGRNISVSAVNGTVSNSTRGGEVAIIAGTIGKSNLIGSMIDAGKIDVSQIRGKWESFITQVVSSPMPGTQQALVIAGSDKRGTIYGMYDLSEQIGVSPWYWWADVPAQQHSTIYVTNTTKLQGPPSVKYRGFFLNDEQPALNNWVRDNYPDVNGRPGFNSQFYSKVYELLLRLRANYLWPAEWASMFDLDDPLNEYTADYYGVVLGTSHTEPLFRWTNEQSSVLKGPWNWLTNEANIRQFLTDGAKKESPYEAIYTMGMRGLGDTSSPTINASVLGEIVAAEQQILGNVFNTTNVSSISQMWCLYKEVGGYFADGLRVPDDITLLWADDNWGNAQRLPLGNETDRAAGAGLYYHFDYVGSPRDYKWINTISLQKTWEQLHLTYERGARQIWIVNVGDLKPLEIPINHFFDLAYDMPKWSSPNSTTDWLQTWASRDFGPTVAGETASIMNMYGMLAGRRKYELVDPSTYSLINYNEADTVLEQWRNLTTRAESVYNSLSAAAQPAFFELILHPCSAAYTLYNIHISAAKNNLYAQQRRTSANTWATQTLNLFNQDHQISQRYHDLLNGKWNHIMDQTHLGYDWWQQPMRNTIPPLAYTQTLEMSLAGNLGLTVEGSNGSVPGDSVYNIANSNFTLVLPPMDPYGPSSRWIEIFSRGTGTFTFQITPTVDWATATPASGTLSASGNNTDQRILLNVDWTRAPSGYSIVPINVTSSTDYGNYNAPGLRLPVNHTIVPSSFHGHVESDRHVSIEPEHYGTATTSGNISYAVIPGYGRTLSGVTLTPVTAPSLTGATAPKLTYPIYLFTQTTANVTVYLPPSLNTDPSRPLRYAIAVDDAEPQIVQPIPSLPVGSLPPLWSDMVSNAAVTNTTKHAVTPGEHTLNLWALEPGVVFQKLVVDLGGVRKSYLGPPESKIV